MKSRGMPAPLVADRELDHRAVAAGGELDPSALRREGDGVDEEVEEDLADAAGCRRRGCRCPLGDVGCDADVGIGEAVLHALDRGGDGRGDVDLGEVELHDAGVDGGEVEDVVDDGEERRRTTT